MRKPTNKLAQAITDALLDRDFDARDIAVILAFANGRDAHQLSCDGGFIVGIHFGYDIKNQMLMNTAMMGSRSVIAEWTADKKLVRYSNDFKSTMWISGLLDACVQELHVNSRFANDYQPFEIVKDARQCLVDYDDKGLTRKRFEQA